MKRWYVPLLAVVLLIVSCRNSTQTPSPGLIVYQAWNKQPSPQLVIADPEGRELRRVDLPDTVQFIMTTPVSNKALINTDSRNWLLLDAAKGTVQDLSFQDGEGQEIIYAPVQFGPKSKQWAVLTNSTYNQTYVLDLETGKVTYLNALADDIGPVSFLVSFSPNDKQVLITTETGLWLASTEDFTKVRRVLQGKPVATGDFSSDSKRVAYSRRGSGEEIEIVTENLDGSDSRVVTVEKSSATPIWVPDTQMLLLLEQGAVKRLDLSNQQMNSLLTYEGQLRKASFVDDNQKFLVGYDREGSVEWALIDLQTGNVNKLEVLKGYGRILYQSPAQKRIIFVDDERLDKAGGRIASLDVESGKVQSLLELEKDDPFTTWWYFPSPDGNLGYMSTWKPDQTSQAWLLDAINGKSYQIAEAASLESAFAPDGRTVVIARTPKDVSQSDPVLEIMSVENRETHPIGKGTHPAWLVP